MENVPASLRSDRMRASPCQHRVCQRPLIFRCWTGRVVPPARSGGVEGNARLTASAAVALLVLLAIEGVTILFIRSLLPVHVFVGMMLIPPIALKLASVGWR